jgi:hypothetical protein
MGGLSVFHDATKGFCGMKIAMQQPIVSSFAPGK